MMDELVAASGYIITGALCLLVGAGMGYYTAAKDLEEERRKAVAADRAERP